MTGRFQNMQCLWLEDQKLKLRQDVPVPVPEKGEALIRVLLAGICSTDLELVRGYYPFNGIPGHEFVGEVVSSPDDPDLIGKRVVGEINIACGNCDLCMSGLTRHCEHRKTLGIQDWNGAFAEYLVLPLINLHEVPDNIPDEMAIFTEPLAAAHEILEQTVILPTDRVLIIGAGRLGQLVAAVMRTTGCELEVVTRYPKQSELLNLLKISTISEHNLIDKNYDLIVEATGSPEGFNLARKSIRPRGRIILKSTYQGNSEVNLSGIVVDEVTVIGSRCGSFVLALQLMSEGKIDPRPLIDEVYPLNQGITAFEEAARPGTFKVLLQPGTAKIHDEWVKVP